MKKLTSIVLIVVLAPFIAFSQSKHFSMKDFAIGKISINGTIDSAVTIFGSPTKVDTLLDQAEGDFITYHFNRVTIWVSRRTKKISSIDVSTSELSTFRGIKIGDSNNKLEKVYGAQPSVTELNRLHENYDVIFRDFTELKYYEYRPKVGAYYLCFYLNHSKIVKIYLFRGLGC